MIVASRVDRGRHSMVRHCLHRCLLPEADLLCRLVVLDASHILGSLVVGDVVNATGSLRAHGGSDIIRPMIMHHFDFVQSVCASRVRLLCRVIGLLGLVEHALVRLQVVPVRCCMLFHHGGTLTGFHHREDLRESLTVLHI